MLPAVQGSGDARVETPQTDGDSVQTASHKSVPSLSRPMGTETRLIVTCCHQFVVCFVVIDPVILVKFTFHFLSVVLSAQRSIWLETPAWKKRRSKVVASQGQGRRAARHAVAEGGSDLFFGDWSRCCHSVVTQRGRAEGIDRQSFFKNILSPARSPWQRR